MLKKYASHNCVDVKIDAGLEIPSLKMYWSTPTTHKWEKEKLPYSAINKSMAVLQLVVSDNVKFTPRGAGGKYAQYCGVMQRSAAVVHYQRVGGSNPPSAFGFQDAPLKVFLAPARRVCLVRFLSW